MAIRILNGGQLHSHLAPNVALTGDIAADKALTTAFVSGAFVVVAADGAADVAGADVAADGVIFNDFGGEDYENNPGIASGKLTVLHDTCIFEVDAAQVTGSPSAGDLLYTDASGLLTTTGSNNAVAKVMDASNSAYLVCKLLV